MTDPVRLFDRTMLRSAFQSLFWVIFLSRKREEKLTKKALADKLGHNKSFWSRAFDEPPNWQIDTISDMSDVLGVDLLIEARDRASGVIYTPTGIREPATTGTDADLFKRVLAGNKQVPQTSTQGEPPAPGAPHSTFLTLVR